jgi:hypothetical protein
MKLTPKAFGKSPVERALALHNQRAFDLFAFAADCLIRVSFRENVR